MREVRDLIAASLISRAAAKADTKTTNAALRDAVKVGKNARAASHAALTTARHALFEEGNTELANRIDSLLAVTASSRADAVLLAQQLGNLGGLLTHAEVAPKLGDAAAGVQTMVTTASSALDVALKSKGRVRGTPAETEQVNLLDGVAVIQLRTVRKAGRAAARALGRPDVATAFELHELYGSASRAREDGPPPTPPVT